MSLLPPLALLLGQLQTKPQNLAMAIWIIVVLMH